MRFQSALRFRGKGSRARVATTLAATPPARTARALEELVKSRLVLGGIADTLQAVCLGISATSPRNWLLFFSGSVEEDPSVNCCRSAHGLPVI